MSAAVGQEPPLGIVIPFVYHTPLTADIVTGKPDAREAAAKPPAMINDSVAELGADLLGAPDIFDETEAEES